MSGIAPGNCWDDDMFTDRVDIHRPSVTGQKNKSGQYRPDRPLVMADVPCKIQRMENVLDVGGTAVLARQQVQVGFPFAVEISPDDILEPKFPSSGSKIRVGSYSYDTTLEFGLAKGVEVT